MDVSSIIILSLIVSAFVGFAAVLAYGDYATQQARRAAAAKAAEPASLAAVPSAPVRKAA